MASGLQILRELIHETYCNLLCFAFSVICWATFKLDQS